MHATKGSKRMRESMRKAPDQLILDVYFAGVPVGTRNVVGRDLLRSTSRGQRAKGGYPGYGWDLELAFVAGLERPGCGLQGTHQDLGGKHAKKAEGFLVHWPISEKRELDWWPGGHKIAEKVREIEERLERRVYSEDGMADREVYHILLREGVEGVPGVTAGKQVAKEVASVPIGYCAGMHACMPHGGRGVPSMYAYEANLGVHGYVLRKDCYKGDNTTYGYPNAAMRCLADVVV
jgi:hypothetical protein